MQPDERQLEERIAAAFDRLPDPDSARLREIEERLARRLAPRAPARFFWWLLAGLAATGAAAWWGGEYLARDALPPAVEASKPAEPTAPIERAQQRPATSAVPAAPATGQREIYRREQY